MGDALINYIMYALKLRAREIRLPNLEDVIITIYQWLKFIDLNRKPMQNNISKAF